MIRIIEATIAVLIVIGFVLTYTAKQEKAENDLTSVITPILQEIADNNTMRNSILSTTPNILQIGDFIKARVSSNLNYRVKICDVDNICALDSYPSDASGDIFAVERIISATPDQPTFAPKKVKIFMWMKG